ncbi:MAG TPA: nucleotidyl transferase AbiEii/AbiGii toxin family protein [Acidimicrobiales bacterium]|nr:nucleotidyl transferase AbiEii/AbiGii toxin family protein [Acidimicrobiales bacterium]
MAATFQLYGDARRPSTRYRDLVDLVAIATTASPDAEAVGRAIRPEFERRGLGAATEFVIPDESLWRPGYEAEANKSLLPRAHTLDEALSIVKPFLDPVFAGDATGTWDPVNLSWGR